MCWTAVRPAPNAPCCLITPYLAQPGTQFYVEGFEQAASSRDWDVNVIDTSGDVAAVISRMEDAVTAGVKAIVINVDPEQVGAGLATAKDAGIPVIGMDAGSHPFANTPDIEVVERITPDVADGGITALTRRCR